MGSDVELQESSRKGVLKGRGHDTGGMILVKSHMPSWPDKVAKYLTFESRVFLSKVWISKNGG